MPIYEYTCQDCQTGFELIRNYSEADTNLVCTQCDGENVKRQISLFNASSGGRTLAGGDGCGSCAGGSCSSCGGH